MFNKDLKEAVMRILPRVQTPAQYLGGELNSIVKDHRRVRGKLCLAFPDAYTLGMSHHGLQVLYTIMNHDPRWACERAFTPWIDFEGALRKHNLPLYSLETFTPLRDFDVIGLYAARSPLGRRRFRFQGSLPPRFPSNEATKHAFAPPQFGAPASESSQYPREALPEAYTS